MILVDYQQIAISNLFSLFGKNINNNLDDGIIRHMILNSIRSHNLKHKHEYGEMVICIDTKKSWRKDHFPYYKASRKITRDKSDLDWNKIFNSLNKIVEEIKLVLPYKFIDVHGAEADDIIAVLSKEYHDNGEIMIISGDKDFVQLQKYNGIKQYDPIRKRDIVTDNPELYLAEHIIKGDTGDGIPNFLSDDDTFVNKEKRQTPIYQKKIEGYLSTKMDDFGDNIKKNINRNRILIDFSKIPERICKSILNEYDKPVQGDHMKLMKYFSDNKMKNLFDKLNDF